MNSSPFSSSNGLRHNNLDFLRFFLACVVIQTHSFEMVGQHYHGTASRLAHFEFGGAWLAVDGFFAVSGFLVAASWLRSKSAADYFRKRALRIYPGFVTAILFCVLVVGPLGGANLTSYFHDPATYAFFKPLVFGPTTTLPGVFESQPWRGVVNGSLWTIRFELFCYVLLATLGLLTLLRHPRLILTLFLVAIAAQFAQEHQWPATWNLVTPFFGDLWEIIRFIVFFLAGTTFYLHRGAIPFDYRVAVVSAVLLVAGFASGLSTLVLPLFGAYLLFFFAFNPRIGLQNFGKYGDMSYGMYLYAFPVQQLFVRYCPFARNPIALTVLAFGVCLILSYLSWHLLEKPFLSLKKTKSDSLAHADSPNEPGSAQIPATPVPVSST